MASAPGIDVEKAFTDDFTFNERRGQCDRLRVETIGQLRLDSGTLVVCDPLAETVALPLVRTVTPGHYPVSVSTWLSERKNDRRAAAARIVFADRPVASWEPALRASPPGAKKKPRKNGAFAVNTATGCFIDGVRAQQFLKDAEEREHRIDAARSSERTWFILGPPEDAEVAGFGTGLGDGAYEVWWGLDAANEPVQLVTEFEVLAREVWEDWSFELSQTGRIEDPRLEKVELEVELLPVWKSRKIDRTRVVALQYSSRDILVYSSLGLSIVAPDGTLIPTQRERLTGDTFGRWAALEKLESEAPFPPGSKLVLSVLKSTKPFRFGA